MRTRSVPLLLVCVWLVAATPAVYAQFSDDILHSIGLLPLNTLALDSYYIKVVREILSPERQEALEAVGWVSEAEIYYKKDQSPDGRERTLTLTLSEPDNTVVLGAPAPQPSADLFFRNYELRITGIDHIADRMCHWVTIVARAEMRPVWTYCIDTETGVTLGVEQFDVDGVPVMRGYATYFEPNPDLSGIEFPDPAAEGIPAQAITSQELQTMVPWIRLPAWTPERFELIATQLMSPEDLAVDVALLHYSDGLERIVLTVLLHPDLPEKPTRAFFEEALVSEELLTSMRAASLSYSGENGPLLSLMGLSTYASATDISKMLWSLLPEDE